MKTTSEMSKIIITTLSVLVCLLLFTIVCYFYANQIATKSLKSRNHQIVSNQLHDSLNDFKIVYFSDVDYDAFDNTLLLDRFTDQMSNIEVNLLLFGGDLFSPEIEEISPELELEITEQLRSIRATSGKFAILGDDDVKTPEIETTIRRIFKNAEFEVLDNTSRRIYTTNHDEYIQLVGISSYKSLRADVNSAFSQVNPDIFTIALVHEPDSFDEIAQQGVHLQLSGHSHGGQVILPFLRPMIDKEYAQNYFNRVYHKKASRLIVSEGIGIEQAYFRFRTNNSYLHIKLLQK